MYMLENILSEYNLTHEQAAEIFGVSNWGLKKLLSGKDELNALQAIKLQDRINLSSGNKVTLDELFRKGDLSGRVADWIIKVWLDGGPSNREYFEQIAGADMAESDKEIKSLLESYIEAESEPGIIRDILKAGAATINYRRVTIALKSALL